MDIKALKYPIYIVSKGRYENPLTAKYFLRDKIPFLIAVEPQEYEKYCIALGKKNVLKLPFSNLGLGSFPARNYCWEHSLKNGHQRHFLFDDNIMGFVKFNKGKRLQCDSMQALLTLQNLTERYEKIGISGFNYRYFVDPSLKKPFFINTHVYSGMLIDNSIKFRWRLKYNEDVDLCLQALDHGLNTILLNVYLINKVSTTAKMKGGNQTELYQNNNEMKKALKTSSLQQMWPKYVESVYRFGRPHHFVNWRKHFTHPLIRKPNFDEIVFEQQKIFEQINQTKVKLNEYKNDWTIT